MKMNDPTFESTGDRFTILARIDSWLEDFEEDEIDAFVLTFRLFTQDNDRISLRSLSKIYANSLALGYLSRPGRRGKISSPDGGQLQVRSWLRKGRSR